MISIIVPIYNAEKYLHACLDSLLCQTVQDLQIILVNDGSTDNSAAIEKEYAAKFKARVEEILGGVYEVPEERIALEAAIFADKANITEERIKTCEGRVHRFC